MSNIKSADIMCVSTFISNYMNLSYFNKIRLMLNYDKLDKKYSLW